MDQTTKWSKYKVEVIFKGNPPHADKDSLNIRNILTLRIKDVLCNVLNVDIFIAGKTNLCNAQATRMNC